MKKRVFVFFFIISFLFTISCEKDENQSPFTFEYETFNIIGERENRFKEGENIIFSLRIYNQTNDPYWVRHYNLNSTNIFKIFRKSNLPDSVFIVKLYNDLVCQTNSVGVPPNDFFEIKTSLYNTNDPKYSNVCNPGDSSFLFSGQYYSSFSYSFEFYHASNGKEYIIDASTYYFEFEIIKN
jgi:hypothetical protein